MKLVSQWDTGPCIGSSTSMAVVICDEDAAQVEHARFGIESLALKKGAIMSCASAAVAAAPAMLGGNKVYPPRKPVSGQYRTCWAKVEPLQSSMDMKLLPGFIMRMTLAGANEWKGRVGKILPEDRRIFGSSINSRPKSRS